MTYLKMAIRMLKTTKTTKIIARMVKIQGHSYPIIKILHKAIWKEITEDFHLILNKRKG